MHRMYHLVGISLKNNLMINYLKFTFYQKNAYFLIELEATKKWIFTRLHLYGVPC